MALMQRVSDLALRDRLNWRANRYGLVALGLGSLALIGFVTRTHVPFGLLPAAQFRVVLSTAMCLALSGGALALEASTPRFRALAPALILVQTLIAVLGLAEHVFNVSLGIDLAALHVWSGDAAQHPGRMGLDTAIGFLAFGVAWLLSQNTPTLTQARCARALIALVIVLAVLGLLENIIPLDFVLTWPGLSRIAVPAGLGLLALGTGLYQSRRDREWYRAMVVRPLSAQQSLGTELVLIAIASAAGLLAFSFMQMQLDRLVSDQMREQLDNRANYFASTLTQSLDRTALVASRPGVIGAYERLSPDATDEAARNALEAIARSFLPYGFTAVDFLDLQDGPLATIGSYRRNAALRVTLSGPGSPQLLWDRGFYLQSSQPIFSNGVKVGTVKTEQPMTGLTRLSATAVEWGETGEVTLCAAASEKMACFPTRFRSTAETMARSVGNQPVPMSHALDGEAGVVKVRDRGGQRVLAAYRPVGSTGLGIVMTLQLAEVYAPLRSGFAAILPLLVLLVILSSVLTRWRMRPVLAQMAASERAVAESENRFRIACESGIDAFLILESVRSGQGTIVDFLVSYVNRNAEKLLGRPRSQLLNQSLGSALPMLLNSGWFDRYKKVVDSGRPSDAEQTVDVPNVAANWVHQHIVPLGDGVAVTLTDISERKRLEQDLRRMAQSDALTELPNRALFLDRLERAMIRARGANDLLAVLSIDVDHFQAFNKEHGHSEGDIVLKTFATRLTDGVRVEDTVARVGGDEFGIILEGLAARSQAFSAAEAILATLRKEIGLTDKTVSVTGSMGIALYSGENTTATKLLERADLALEEVKRRGQDAYYAAEATFARPPHRA